MNKIEEIERAVEQLPLIDFVKLADRVDQRRKELQVPPCAADRNQRMVRDHSAFLTSYIPEDEGLFDDGPAR